MSDRTRLDEPRHDTVREWETFARREASSTLRHVGSVTAATAERAHDHASRLFPDAATLWVCPTDEVARFTHRDLGDRYADSVADEHTDANTGDEEGDAAAPSDIDTIDDGDTIDDESTAEGTTDAAVANAGVDQ